MRTIFVLDGKVIGMGFAGTPEAVISCVIPNAVGYVVPDGEEVDVGDLRNAITGVFSPDLVARAATSRISQWQAIKAKRDTIKSAGAPVGAFWFHTDADSRIQQLGLKDQARDVLAAGGITATVLQKLGQDIPWQTMSGVAVPMTVQLSFDVVAAVGDLDALCHYVGLQHKAAMEASADPAAYDFSGGWPVAFGG